MRIAYLTQSYFPMASSGAIFARQLAEAMLTLGHQVLVITASDKDHHYHTYRENLTIVRLGSIRDPFHAGERMFLHPHRSIIKTLTQFQPDIIHIYASIQIGMSALGYAKRVNIPILLTVRASGTPALSPLFKPMFEGLYWWYAGQVIRQYNAILVPTETMEIQITRMTGCKSIAILTENHTSMEIFEKYERIYHKTLSESSGGRKLLSLWQRVKEKLISILNNAGH